MSANELKIGNKVIVRGTDIVGTVKQIGARGVVMLDILTEHSIFDRTVFHVNELENVG